jgi:hypothetical protein
MGAHTRFVYLTPAKLLCYKRERDKDMCYMPICRNCKKYLLYQIAIVHGQSQVTWRYTCISCALRIYPKRYLLNLINKHLRKLSKGPRNRGYYIKYMRLKQKIKQDAIPMDTHA